MATAKAIPTQSQWIARALELAEREHLTGTARMLAENALHVCYAVRKSSVVGEYTIRLDRWYGSGELRGLPSCGCIAGQHDKPCKHAGAALHAEQVRARALATPDTDPLQNWRRGGEW